MLYQINQEILKASKNVDNNLKAVQLKVIHKKICNCNFDSCKPSCKFTFTSFLFFRKNQRQEWNFQQVIGVVTCFLFIVNCALP